MYIYWLGGGIPAGLYSCDEQVLIWRRIFQKTWENSGGSWARWESLCLWCFVSDAMNRCTSKCMWRINTSSKLGSFALISPWLYTVVWCWYSSSSQNSSSLFFLSISISLWIALVLCVCVCAISRQLTVCCMQQQQHSLVLICRRHNNKPMLCVTQKGLVILAPSFAAELGWGVDAKLNRRQISPTLWYIWVVVPRVVAVCFLFPSPFVVAPTHNAKKHQEVHLTMIR